MSSSPPPPTVSLSPSTTGEGETQNIIGTSTLTSSIRSLRINETGSGSSWEEGGNRYMNICSGGLGPIPPSTSERIPAVVTLTTTCTSSSTSTTSTSSTIMQQQSPSQPSPPSSPPNIHETPPPKLKSILPPFLACTYTSFYCEENIWLLCDKIRTEYLSELDHCHVVFISNPKRMIPLWRQKSGKTEEKLAIWDYHVILLYNPDDRCVVYDMESDLPFPTHFHKYVTETFRTESILQPEYHRFFRILHARNFLQLFSSNRSHMMKSDGSYVHSPPLYPPICSHGINNLEEFLDMTTPPSEKTEFGEVLPLMDLVRRYYKPKRVDL